MCVNLNKSISLMLYFLIFNGNSTISILSMPKIFVRILIHNYKITVSLIIILIEVFPK